ILIGDVIHNLRSALDHIVYAISFSRNPDEFRDDRTTEFPICDKPSSFASEYRQKQIRGLPLSARAIIEALQPYSGKKVSHEPLWTLREMSNVDKHRSIHVAADSTAEVGWDITRIDPAVTVHSLDVEPVGLVESGTVLATLEVSVPAAIQSTVSLNMNRRFSFTVAFDDDTPLPGVWVLDALDNMIACAEGVVGALDRFVERP
ncbi:MAG: hypothetical protein IIC90_13115, partial [Chloroflexi bacterium]|nr:hypothetical protein [Chloroflexota bacterium]